jgi:hypothetical protein
MPDVTVTVRDAAGNATAVIVPFTVGAVPAVPTGLDAAPGSQANSALVTWPSVAGATSYDFAQSAVILGNTPSPDWLATALTPNTQYSFQARSRNANGFSGWSTAIFYTTPSAPPPPPPQTGWPDATNTGVPTGTVLTASGAITVSTAGTIIENRDITGGITVNAPNVIIRRCRIRSSTFYVVRNNSTGLLIEDSEIDGLLGTSNSMGMGNTGFTMRRCNVHGTENGFNIGGTSTVLVEDSYIHNLYTGGGAHTDGAQFNQGASNITFRHNQFVSQPGSTSCIIMWDGSGTQNANVLIENNRLLGAGAAYTIYTPRQGPLTNVRIRNNRFGRATFGYNGGITSLVTEWSGNVDDQTNAPI